MSYPLSRGADLDGGGVADLQTDVMRFMAIISLCLVAIFALVQSIPATPVSPRPAPLKAARTLVPPVVEVPEPIDEIVPEPVVQPAPEPEPTPVSRPAPIPEPTPIERRAPEAAPVQPVVSEPPPAETREEGFTLRFASDTALKALVAREEVGLYAIDGNRAMRLGSDRGRLQFWQASLPKQVHEMDAATVPTDVTRALSRSGANDSVYWGVTLTASLSRQLDRYLGSASSGELVIAADGNMRLE